MNNMPKTYKEAVEMGYTRGVTAYQRGYVSRRGGWENQLVHVAGGARKGQLYVLVPCWTSTQYCVRQYLNAPEGK